MRWSKDFFMSCLLSFFLQLEKKKNYILYTWKKTQDRLNLEPFLVSKGNYHIQSWKTRISKTTTVFNNMEKKYLSSSNKSFKKPYPANVPDLSYIMLPHVQILIGTDTDTDSWWYLGSTVGGGYVAKPPLSLCLYNSKKQGFSYYFLVIHSLGFHRLKTTWLGRMWLPDLSKQDWSVWDVCQIWGWGWGQQQQEHIE